MSQQPRDDDDAFSMHDDDAHSMVSEGGSDVFLKIVYEAQQRKALVGFYRLHLSWVKDAEIAAAWYKNYGTDSTDRHRYQAQRDSALIARYIKRRWIGHPEY